DGAGAAAGIAAVVGGAGAGGGGDGAGGAGIAPEAAAGDCGAVRRGGRGGSTGEVPPAGGAESGVARGVPRGDAAPRAGIGAVRTASAMRRFLSSTSVPGPPHLPLRRSMLGSGCHRYRKAGSRLRSAPGKLTGNSDACSGTFGVVANGVRATSLRRCRT